eukprot:6264325-Lingulodinium_polyedra.AAC.1
MGGGPLARRPGGGRPPPRRAGAPQRVAGALPWAHCGGFRASATAAAAALGDLIDLGLPAAA